MPHDFVNFPELSNSQMEVYYFESPHKQIVGGDFRAKVIKVTDGDTIKVNADFRDFDFPIRFLGIDTKELSEGGEEAKQWLRKKIEGLEVTVEIDSSNRVGKYGRLLGRILSNGLSLNEEMLRNGLATTFEARDEGKITNIKKELAIEKWL